jgi:hypothetical protein
MSVNYSKGQAIQRGFNWRCKISIGGKIVPMTGDIIGQIRQDSGQPLIASVSTADGTIVRTTSSISVNIPALVTNTIPENIDFVYMDFGVVNGADIDYLGFKLKIPVKTPITDLIP